MIIMRLVAPLSGLAVVRRCSCVVCDVECEICAYIRIIGVVLGTASFLLFISRN